MCYYYHNYYYYVEGAVGQDSNNGLTGKRQSKNLGGIWNLEGLEEVLMKQCCSMNM